MNVFADYIDEESELEFEREENVPMFNGILKILIVTSIRKSTDLRIQAAQMEKVTVIKTALDVQMKKVFNYIEDDCNQKDIE